MMQVFVRRFAAAAILLSVLAVQSGCGGYRIEGVVQRGDYGDLFFVDRAATERDSAETISGAEIRLHRDAGRPNQRLVATGRSDDNGRVVLALEQFGAGWMEEQWLIQVMRRGYETIERVVTLPPASRKQRLMILLREGRSEAPGSGRPDPMEDFERFRR